MEETALTIAPVGLAGHRDVLLRDETGRVARHFVVLAFAARWLAGEPVLNDELAESRWIAPAELAALKTTEGLSEIVGAAFTLLNTVR
jgi:ADP-ribose pyrophosphatase YjhB (NUDIX family)